jgi:aspartate-semialdehyde dehydrogenase
MASKTKKLKVAVVGATGLVGREILRLVADLNLPVGKMLAFCSERSAGTELVFKDQIIEAKLLDRKALKGKVDVVLASGGKQVSQLLRAWSREDGYVVIDNSSTFRMDPEVPLVVPEVNPEELANHHGYIANPNCTTIPLTLVLDAVRETLGLKSVFVATYQSVSGAGNAAIEELAQQTMSLLTDGTAEAEVFPHRIAFNLIPQIGAPTENGYTEEEMKVVNECRRILKMPKLDISCTAVRVPVFACHGEAIQIRTEKECTAGELAHILASKQGLTVLDAPKQFIYPMPINAVEAMDCFVGRIRKHPSLPCTFDLWLVADNLWKGAALNAVQIAGAMAEGGLL